MERRPIRELKRGGVSRRTVEHKRHFDSSDQLCRYVYDTFGATQLISFSRGKDALGAWLKLKEFGFTVRPFFLVNIPGLQFIERSLAYYEDVFKTPIDRYTHPSFREQLENCVHQTPPGWPIVTERGQLDGLAKRSIRAVEDDMRSKYACPSALVATGVRAADSFTRYTSLKKHGSLTYSRLKFHPVYDWSTKDLLERLRVAGLRLPHEYRWLGRTYDGLHGEYLEPLKREHPDDYAQVLRFFGMAEAEVVRVELYKRHGMGGAPS